MKIMCRHVPTRAYRSYAPGRYMAEILPIRRKTLSNQSNTRKLRRSRIRDLAKVYSSMAVVSSVKLSYPVFMDKQPPDSCQYASK